MLKFSIIIPIYNRATFIKKTLNSVLNQTYKNIEIICVNDFSTDKSLEILNEFAQKDPRIKIVSHEKNLGTHMARKNGVQNATGDYILFLDADDELLPNACEILVEKLKIKNVDVIEFGYLYRKETRLPNKKINISNFFTSLVYPQNARPGTIWNKVYSTELVNLSFSKMTDFYSTAGQDLLESTVIAYYTKSYCQIDEVLYFYMYNKTESVSFRKKTFSQIEKYLKSINANIKAFETFFSTYAPEHKKTLCYIESSYLKYVFYLQILDNVKKSEWKKCLILLPKYFSEEAVAPYLKKINASQFFIEIEYIIKKYYDFIKSLFPQSFKNRVKKILKKDEE